jgi:hypothetical protein
VALAECDRKQPGEPVAAAGKQNGRKTLRQEELFTRFLVFLRLKGSELAFPGPQESPRKQSMEEVHERREWDVYLQSSDDARRVSASGSTIRAG